MENRNLVNQICELIKGSERIIVLTGAGISKESGIPVFRGKDGLYGKYRAEELATPEALKEKPFEFWKWYNWRREIILRAQPNAAHKVLVRIEKLKGEKFLLVTQNVDNLHRLAGTKNLIELHGNIFKEICETCGFERWQFKVYKEDELPPLCPYCGSVLRPGVVLFGEYLKESDLRRAFDFAGKANMALVIGTSGAVRPASDIPFVLKENGGIVVEINPEETELSFIADIKIREPAARFMERLGKCL